MSDFAKDSNTMDASWKLYDAERMANKRLLQQLAASQAREVQLREAARELRGLANHFDNMRIANVANEALAIPRDTTALEDMVAKAGEVMRERCLSATNQDNYTNDDDKHVVIGCNIEIRAIPGVTLEDLK